MVIDNLIIKGPTLNSKWRHGAMDSPREPPSDMPITAMLPRFIGSWRPGTRAANRNWV